MLAITTNGTRTSRFQLVGWRSGGGSPVFIGTGPKTGGMPLMAPSYPRIPQTDPLPLGGAVQRAAPGVRSSGRLTAGVVIPVCIIRSFSAMPSQGFAPYSDVL